MSNNALKLPLAQSLAGAASQRALSTAFQRGRAIPVSVISRNGQFVTVSFQVQGPFTLSQQTMTVATSTYDWVPLQEGDSGFVIPSEVYLGAVTGSGGAAAQLGTNYGNLSGNSLIFIPVASKLWTPPGGDTNLRVMQGPGGALVQDLQGKSSIRVTPGAITITVAGGVKVNVTGGGTLSRVVTEAGPSPVLSADG